MIPLLTRLTLHHKPNTHYMLLTKSAVNEIWNSFDLHFKEESYDLFTYGLLCTQYYTTYARKSFSSLPAEINATQSLNFLLPVDEFVDKLSPMPGIQTRNELFKKLCVICTSNHINLQATLRQLVVLSGSEGGFQCVPWKGPSCLITILLRRLSFHPQQ